MVNLIHFWQTESHSFLILSIILILILGVGIFLSVWNWKKNKIISLFLIFICVCIGWGFFVEPYRLIVNNFSIKSEKLPTIKIAVVSDFHLRFGKSNDWVKKIVQK